MKIKDFKYKKDAEEEKEYNLFYLFHHNLSVFLIDHQYSFFLQD